MKTGIDFTQSTACNFHIYIIEIILLLRDGGGFRKVFL